MFANNQHDSIKHAEMFIGKQQKKKREREGKKSKLPGTFIKMIHVQESDL